MCVAKWADPYQMDFDGSDGSGGQVVRPFVYRPHGFNPRDAGSIPEKPMDWKKLAILAAVLFLGFKVLK